MLGIVRAWVPNMADFHPLYTRKVSYRDGISNIVSPILLTMFLIPHFKRLELAYPLSVQETSRKVQE
jgi:hypothetical protein